MPTEDTIRGLLERIRDDRCIGTPQTTAIAAILLLNGSEREMRSGYDQYDGNWKPLPTGRRIVLDPLPDRGGARHAH